MVDAAQVVGGRILFHVDGVFVGEHALNGFVEGAGRMFRYPAVDFGDFSAARPCAFHLAFRRHLFGQIRVAVGQMDDGVCRHDFQP